MFGPPPATPAFLPMATRLIASLLAASQVWFAGHLTTATPHHRPLLPHPHRIPSAPCGGGGDSAAREGYISSTQSDATKAGLQILCQEGGNAADAAAAVQFALAVTQPQSTGIGGGSFILRRDGVTSDITALDGREEAPRLFHPKVFCLDEDCLLDPECECLEGPIPSSERSIGGLAVGVPGVVAAAARLVADNGTLPLAVVLAPAIELAAGGFVMYEGLHTSIAASAAKLRRFEATRALFLDADGTAPRIPVGGVFTNPDLAETLRMIAAEGPAAFYAEGAALPAEIVAAAQHAVNDVTGKYGLMELGDMTGYAAVYRQPVVSTYRGRTIFGFPMPSSGGASLALALNYLEGWDIAPSTSRLGGAEMYQCHACSRSGWKRPAVLFDISEIQGGNAPPARSLAGMRPEHVGRFIDAQNAAFADRNLYMADAGTTKCVAPPAWPPA
jgi:gamma-glutamyltranspeptidase